MRLCRARTRRLAFPLALGVFLLPLPERLPNPLWLATASASTSLPILDALGLTVSRKMTDVYTSPTWAFRVSANCSGAATFYSAIVIGVLLTRASPQRGWIALFLAWPTTVAVNGARIAAIVFADTTLKINVLSSALHGLSGIVTFWLVLGTLFLMADRERLREALE